MITHEFTIGDWTVHCYYAVDCFYIEDIIEELWHLGCNGSQAEQAYKTMKSCEYNRGFTYSSLISKTSVVVIGKCSSEGEFINTLVHECRHLQQHIAIQKQLDENSEDVCYLIGKICQIMYEKCREENLL